jgi:predicted Zn-dependent protease
MNMPLAAGMFRRAIAARSDYGLSHSNLAAALHQLGQLDESTLELQRSIALQRLQVPRLRQTWVLDLNRLGQSLMESGKPQEAAAALTESLSAKPDQPDTVAILKLAEAQMRSAATTRASSSVTR